MRQHTCIVTAMDAEIRDELSKLGISNTSAPLKISSNAEDYTNAEDIEQLWAIKTVKYAEAHMKLLKARDGKELRLTKYDDEMYAFVMAEFKDIKLDVIDVDNMKTEASKAKWREFCSQYEHFVTDYNFATLLRTNSSKEYSEDNTFIVPRIQFLAIEVARNRIGLNSSFKV